jgi:hypothetical protein
MYKESSWKKKQTQQMPAERILQDKEAIRNWDSKDTDNIGHTRHRMKTKQNTNTTEKTIKMSNTDPIKKNEGRSGTREV